MSRATRPRRPTRTLGVGSGDRRLLPPSSGPETQAGIKHSPETARGKQSPRETQHRARGTRGLSEAVGTR